MVIEADDIAVIDLGDGVLTVIDREDYPLVSLYKWRKLWSKRRQVYTVIATIEKRTVSLHRFVINAPQDKQVDHKDLDTLNNRKTNLRLVTGCINAINQSGAMKNNNTTGIRAVSICRTTGKFRARPQFENKRYSLGSFSTLIEAALAVLAFMKDVDEIAHDNYRCHLVRRGLING